MKLLTQELKRSLPPLYDNENKHITGADTPIVCKYFCPWNKWTWFVAEGSPVCPNHGHYDCKEPECGPSDKWADFLFFCYVVGDEPEWGYVALEILESIKGPGGLGIERDLYFKPRKFGEIKRYVGN